MTPQEFAQLMKSNQQLAIGPHGDQAHDLLQPGSAKPAYTMTSNRVPTEHEEQVALFQWAEANTTRLPALERLVAIPNGGYRHPATAFKMKEEGQKAGVPDIVLFEQRWDGDGSTRYGAMFIELKRSDHSNHPTKEQQDWIAELNDAGYYAVVAYGCKEAIQYLECYLADEAPLVWEYEDGSA